MITMNTYSVIDRIETGRNIGHLLKSNDVTPRELQQYLGFSGVQAIYRWMDGSNVPSVDNLLLLSHLWSIPMNDILRYRIVEYDRV